MYKKYKNDFLKEVIVRVDFTGCFNFKELPLKIKNSIIEFFPIEEPQEITKRTAKFKLPKKDEPLIVEQDEHEIIIKWTFHGKNREKRLIIDEDFLVISIYSYSNFEELKDMFNRIVDSFIQVVEEECRIKRFGLRYINHIELNDRNPFSWRSYLNNNLLGIFKVYEDNSKISRAFHNLSLNLGDIKVVFQYGMHNPDYPAPILKKIYILDIDAYYEGMIDKDELDNYIERFHIEIINLFEISIKDKLRGKMGRINP